MFEIPRHDNRGGGTNFRDFSPLAERSLLNYAMGFSASPNDDDASSGTRGEQVMGPTMVRAPAPRGRRVADDLHHPTGWF